MGFLLFIVFLKEIIEIKYFGKFYMSKGLVEMKLRVDILFCNS